MPNIIQTLPIGEANPGAVHQPRAANPVLTGRFSFVEGYQPINVHLEAEGDIPDTPINTPNGTVLLEAVVRIPFTPTRIKVDAVPLTWSVANKVSGEHGFIPGVSVVPTHLPGISYQILVGQDGISYAPLYSGPGDMGAAVGETFESWSHVKLQLVKTGPLVVGIHAFEQAVFATYVAGVNRTEIVRFHNRHGLIVIVVA